MNITQLNLECIRREKGKKQINIAQGREYLRQLAIILAGNEKAMKKFAAYGKKAKKKNEAYILDDYMRAHCKEKR